MKFVEDQIFVFPLCDRNKVDVQGFTSANRIFKFIAGKSLSEALIFASTNPQYDNRLFIVHENCKPRIPAEHVVYTNCCFCFDIQNNVGTQHFLQILQASEKDLPVIRLQKLKL